MNTMHISGKRWFNRTCGNTYYSATAWYNGEVVANIAYAYGYGDQYLYETLEQAADEIGMPVLRHKLNNSQEPPWQWAERVGVKLNYEVSDVARKKDL